MEKRCRPRSCITPIGCGSKDPDPVDYSTGSVGIGATADLGVPVRRYVNSVGVVAPGGDLGRPADVVCVTSAGLVFDAVQVWAGRGPGESWVLDAAFPARRATPMVTVLDGHPHSLAFLAGVNQVRATHRCQPPPWLSS